MYFTCILMQLTLERVWTKKDPRGSLRKKTKKTWIYTVPLIYAFQQPLNNTGKAFETLKKCESRERLK